MKRREFLQAASAAAMPAFAKAAEAPASATKTFRWAINFAETGFDPAQISDLASNYVVTNVFEAPLGYDPLARPAVIRPRTAAAMPEISADFRTITVRVRPGIYFQDDPAFKGKPRELVAADYVYNLKRVADPRWKSPLWPTIENGHVVGLAEARKRAQTLGKFDYDGEIDGIRTLDRYTFRIHLRDPSPRFYENLTDARVFGAVAREIVEAYPDEIMGKPVGTGPFRLAQWARSSKIVLERNPTFRAEFYDAAPATDDATGQNALARLRGRRLPLVDRIELSIIEENQPRWLSFLNGQQDAINIPAEYINVGAPNGQLSPALTRQGIELQRMLNPDIVVTYFNMDDPVVGGYSPEKVALRRAVSLGYNTEEEIRLVRRGAMRVAQSQVPPLTFGYDDAFASEMGSFDRARARALLDLYGYVDRDGDGWREQPDGSPLLLQMATQSSQIDRAFNEMWKRQLDALGVRIEFVVNQWPENNKSARTGKLMMWGLGWSATGSDPDSFLALGHSGDIGGSNYARFKRAEYDELYNLQRQLPDGPERAAAIFQMKRLFAAWMPYKVHGHRYINDLVQPWLVGYRRHPFARDFFKYVDIDDSARPA
jgi:ABC-type transport system substrate-binding protein